MVTIMLDCKEIHDVDVGGDVVGLKNWPMPMLGDQTKRYPKVPFHQPVPSPND